MAGTMEVIRSNASAIWGNAAGGVISISTLPAYNTPFIQFDASGGSYNFRKYFLEAGSLFGSSKIYTQFSMSTADGFRQNSDAEKYLLNIGMNSPLTDKTLLGIHLIGASSKFSIPGPLTQTQFDSMPSMANLTYGKNQERRYNRLARIGVNLEHNFDDANSIYTMAFVSPKFLQRSERGTFRDFTRYYLGTSASYRNTFQFNDNYKNTALAGFDEAYQDGAILFYFLDSKAERGNLKTDKKEGANSFGAYLQDEFSMFDKLSILLGLRYDRIDYYNALYYENPDFFNNFSQDKTFEHATPKAAVSYRFSPWHSIYFSYGGGVEVPAGNETDPVKDTVLVNPMLNKPIVSTTYEIGTKQLISFDNILIKSISYELAGYLLNVENDLIPYSGGKYYMPAAKTTRMGIEAGLNMNITEHFDVVVSLTYSDNKYKDYKVDSSLINSKFTGTADLSNNRIAGLPGMYYFSALRYYNTDLLGFLAEVNIQGTGNYFADDVNKFEVPSFSVINAKLGIDKLSLFNNSINIKIWLAFNNLTDKKYAASSFINPLMFDTKQAMYLEPGLPRNYVFGVSVCWK